MHQTLKSKPAQQDLILIQILVCELKVILKHILSAIVSL